MSHSASLKCPFLRWRFHCCGIYRKKTQSPSNWRNKSDAFWVIFFTLYSVLTLTFVVKRILPTTILCWNCRKTIIFICRTMHIPFGFPVIFLFIFFFWWSYELLLLQCFGNFHEGKDWRATSFISKGNSEREFQTTCQGTYSIRLMLNWMSRILHTSELSSPEWWRISKFNDKGSLIRILQESSVLKPR